MGRLSKEQHLAFSKGYQSQHDDMFADLKEHFSDIQTVMLDHPYFKSMETLDDFEDFGQQAFLYKLEQYCKQVRLLRKVQDKPNTYEKGCQHEAMETITALNGDEYEICSICNYSKKVID